MVSNAIEPNDIVNGRTFVKIKIGSAEERAKEAVKRAVFLGIGLKRLNLEEVPIY